VIHSTGINMSLKQKHPAVRSQGFTLVEVLVALMVLSIGLLGVGKLVLFSSRSNDSAYMRSQATAYGYALLDHMRANKLASATYNQGGALLNPASLSNPGNCNVSSPCANALLAQYDLYNWGQDLLRALGPTANGSILITTSTDPVTLAPYLAATVTVQWDDTVARQSFGAAAGLASVTLQSIL
jgi:type IV pilus assembly protein PilV